MKSCRPKKSKDFSKNLLNKRNLRVKLLKVAMLSKIMMKLNRTHTKRKDRKMKAETAAMVNFRDKAPKRRRTRRRSDYSSTSLLS